MTRTLDFRRLPVEPDNGFPQRFEVPLGAATFDFMLYASLPHDPREPLETVHDFAPVEKPPTPVAPRGYLVLRVERRGADGPRVVLLRKVVPDPSLVHHAAELAIVVERVQIARGNINAPGKLGSIVDAWVARRWG